MTLFLTKYATAGKLNALLVLLFGLIVTSRIKTYTLWTQITDLYYLCGAYPNPEYGTDPFALFAVHHPHALRFLAMWPLIEFTHLTGLSFDTTFPWFLLIVLYTTSWVLSKILPLLQLSRGPTRLDQPMIFALMLLISMLMNGRMAMVCLGVSLILYAQLYFLVHRRGKIQLGILQGLGFLLCSVSSGSFTVACCLILCFQASFFLIHFSKNRTLHKNSLCYLLAFAALSLPFMYLFVAKNLAYFNYSLSKMMLHGFPEIFYDYGVDLNVLLVVFSVYFVVVFLATMRWNLTCLKKENVHGPLILLIGFSLSIGTFGYSTLATMLPGIVLLAVISYKRYIRAVPA